MRKVCAIIILSIFIANSNSLPQKIWSRPVRNPQGQLVRERRQFPFGDWIPLNQQCPTCRPVADTLDLGFRGDSIGLTPPRPPTTRQIHGEGNFFAQDESSILSVPPPPPSAIPRHPITNPNSNFQFSNFPQQFNGPLPGPTQQIFPQAQQLPFLTQTFLQNQQLPGNNNQQILTSLNSQNNVFGQENQNKQQITNGKLPKFETEFKTQKLPENVVLEQNKRPQPFFNKPTPFALPQHQQQQQQQFGIQQPQQQAFTFQQQQQQNGIKITDTILTPPPAPTNISQDVIIPGLNKEEIQLLYVPVETLRQRGNFQQQQLLSQQNIQFNNRPSPTPLSPSTFRPTEPSPTKVPKGHFVTQNDITQGSLSTFKVTPSKPFSTPVTPSSLLFQQLPFQQTPQPFVSATPVTPTTPNFVSLSSASQKFSPFTPETTLSHLVTVPDNGQLDFGFSTTPNSLINQEISQNQFVNGKTQFTDFKENSFAQQQPKPEILQQSFGNQQIIGQPQQGLPIFQNQQKQVEIQNQQINQQPIVLQKQQEQQKLLQEEKQLQEQILLKQQQEKEIEAQRLLQQQKEKEIEAQRLLQQQKEKELEEQRLLLLKKQKELEEQKLAQEQLVQQRFLQQQKQKELEQQRRQKELEEQRLLQQQRQKELEEQRYLQQQNQKKLEQQRFLQQQREKELENQRRLQLQRQRELEEKRRLQALKQKEEEQRLYRLQQQQQRELEEKRLLKQQQEEQQRLLLERQKQENAKKQTQIPFYQQQVNQQQFTQQANRHKLPANDHLNSISQLEKESEQEGSQLVPHQPPLSVFYKGQDGAEARITDVLKELRSSNRITVLDQYFEKMPKVFVGPAGLNPPVGYGKFELPYLSNIENNRIERKIDRLPFFVAPLNFVPPPGYAKIPFPAPHVGSVVVSSESNPAMKFQQEEKENNGGFGEGNGSESFSMVGPELPGLINNLETETTTLRPATFPSTPSLPQTTAQLRNRRPNSNLYKTQTRKPITRTRYQTTTIKPEEEVTQPIQKAEVSKETDSGFRKPFNRFLNRRRQQANAAKNQQEDKTLENRHYSVEVYHQQKNTNSLPKSQVNAFGSQKLNVQSEIGSIDRSTPGDLDVYRVSSTPGFPETGSSIETDGSKLDSYSDVSLQSFEDGPLPTGSAKTITQELYRPNILQNSNEQPKQETAQNSEKVQYSSFEEQQTSKYSEVNPTAVFSSTTSQEASEEHVNVPLTQNEGFEQQNVPQETSEKYYATEQYRTEYTPISITVPPQEPTKGIADSNIQITSAFADLSKHHHFPVPTGISKKEQSTYQDSRPTPDTILHTTYSQEQQSQEFLTSGNDKSQFAQYENNQFSPNATSGEKLVSGFHSSENSASEIATSQVNPTAPAAAQDQYTTGFSAISGFSQNAQKIEEERRPSFISFSDVSNPSEVPLTPSPQPEYYPSSTLLPQGHIEVSDISKYSSQGKTLEGNQASVTEEPKLSDIPSTPAFKLVSKDAVEINDEKHTTEGQEDNLPGSHRLKLQNPSIVRVRTRGRGKPRGQINFASSQSTTQAPIIRHRVENKIIEHADQESTTKTNAQDYQPIRTSKYNTYRGLKKPVRTTTEPPATTEHEHKVNVYTIRPQKRPSNPSTVSTKRIRRPTTPLSTIETATESFGISTAAPYYHQTDNGELSPSGFSNDVYYEHTSLTPVRQKFRKHFGSAEQKNDVISVQTATPFLTTPQVQTSPEYTEELKDFSQTPATVQQHSEAYPEWNPSESGIDVSGIVLTTAKTTNAEEEEEVEEPKKSQDNKKAFDPDLEKKSGRRRVRVRVHKRPHENFETAESQNLRTVANVLVPPTSTYKPSDETNFHQLAKNSDFSFGGNKNYGVRSREYFRKRLNLTQIDATENKEEQTKTGDDAGEKATRTKVLSFVRKIPHKTNHETVPSQSSEVSEDDGSKIHRTKHRGYVRKVIKHKGGSKIVQTEAADNEETEEKRAEFHSRQNFKENVDDQTQGGRFNGTRHRTIIRYVKKNKPRPHEAEPELEVTAGDAQIDQQKSTESAKQEEVNEVPTTQKQAFEQQTSFSTESLPPVVQTTQESKSKETEEYGTQQPAVGVSENEENEVKETTQSLVQTTQEPIAEEENQNLVTGSGVSESESETSQSTQTQEQATFRNSFRQHSSKAPEPVSSEAPSTQKTLFNQNLRPVFQRPPYTGFQRSRDSTTERVKEVQEKKEGPLRPKYGKTSSYSTTEAEEVQDKRDGPLRPKYGKTSSYSTTEAEEVQDKRDGPLRPKYGKTSYSTTEAEEVQRVNNFQTEQQIKNKNLHTLEVRKYLRTKSKEGAFSSFSKNRYYTSEKTETATTKKENTKVSEPEESTTPFEESTSAKKFETTASESKSETTQSFVASTTTAEGEVGTTKLDEELSTTEESVHSSEENSTESEESESESEENSSSVESTTESLSNTHSESVETSTEAKTEEETTTQKVLETQPDLYRFSKSSFSFDEAEKFTGTQNRAHVRNITADIIENTASFSAPGVEKKIVPLNNEEELPKTTEFDSGVTRIAKTEETTTEQNTVETTTEYPETEAAVTATEQVTKPKVTKLIKTSTQTKISHETEICYKGKCIRTKSENPDDDLKLLVDSATTTKLQTTTT